MVNVGIHIYIYIHTIHGSYGILFSTYFGCPVLCNRHFEEEVLPVLRHLVSAGKATIESLQVESGSS